MSQMIALGQLIRVNCPCCGIAAWRVPVMLGTVRLTCGTCLGKATVRFYIERGLFSGPTFKMDVNRDLW